MFNNIYLIDIRKNKESKPTPPQMLMTLFDKTLTEKDKIWLAFEEEVIINKNELTNVPFEHNLRNILFISNHIMSYQIIRTLYENDYNPFQDKINLDWFNQPQQKYLKNCFEKLKEIEKAKTNILFGMTTLTDFIMTEFYSKDINIKDLFFFYGIDILFTFEDHDPIVKIYFNPETTKEIVLFRFMQKLYSQYKGLCKLNKESLSVEINKSNIQTLDIFNLFNEIDFEGILKKLSPEEKSNNISLLKNKYKGKFKK